MKIIVGREINGISLNGIEFLKDENNQDKVFNSVEDAKEFLTEHGLQNTDDFIYMNIDQDFQLKEGTVQIMATRLEIQINATKKRIAKTEVMIERDLKKLNKQYLYLVKKGVFELDQFSLGDENKTKRFTVKQSEKFYTATRKAIEKIQRENLIRPQDRDQKVWDSLFDAGAYANDFRIDTNALGFEKEKLIKLENQESKVV